MNADKMYIPDKDKWMNYYQSVIQGKNNSYLTHMQSGGKNATFMIPIQKHASALSEKSDPVKIQLVSPSVQMVDMAKQTLKGEGVGIKRRKRKQTTSHKTSSEGGHKARKKTKTSVKRRENKDVFSD